MDDEIPFVAVGNDQLKSFIVNSGCKECGAKVEFPIGELIWCAKDPSRPRPKCKGCGRAVSIERVVE